MKSKYLFIVLLVFLFSTVHAVPVIINDTGNWKGEIQAKEEGFLVYNVGMWTQYGANYHSGETILTFADDFSPVITNEGTNYVTCTYDEVGWIWPYGGPKLEETISFDTRNLVVNSSDTIYSSNYVLHSNILDDVKSGSDFPSSGYVSVNNNISFQNNTVKIISGTMSYISTASAIVGLIPLLGKPAGVISLILDVTSKGIDYFTITSITYSGKIYPNSIPMSNELWVPRGVVKCDLYRKDILLYKDKNNEGFCIDGSNETIYFAYANNVSQDKYIEIIGQGE